MKVLKIASIAAVLLLLAGVYAGGQAAANEGHKSGMMGAMSHHEGQMEGKMKDCHQNMTTNLEALDGKIATMENSSGDEKVVAIAAVVEELVAQQKTMHQQMACMNSCMDKETGALPDEPDESLSSSLEAHVKYHY